MEVLAGNAQRFMIYEDGTRFHNQVGVPTMDVPMGNILEEGDNTSHSAHLGGNKLYKELKQTF